MVVITRVVDGDTYKFAVGTDTIGIRLLGVDCFEVRHSFILDVQAERCGITPDSAYALGLEGKFLAEKLLTGKTVIIRRDRKESNFDNFGRLLRSVEFDGTQIKDVLETAGLTVKRPKK